MSTSPVRCSGYHNDSIVITYNIPPSLQLSYHSNPGQRHQGKHAVAYLPNSVEGQDLLKRLKYAFMHGLTFTVGTSMTTGVQNQCTWGSIHHKTHTSRGVGCHGFPDPNYFENCNKELDYLNVPAASILDDDGNK